MITCREVDSFLDDYLEGSLPEESRRTFEMHLGRCPPCRVYMDAYLKTAALAKSSAAGSGPSQDEIPEELVNAILAAQKKSP